MGCVPRKEKCHECPYHSPHAVRGCLIRTLRERRPRPLEEVARLMNLSVQEAAGLLRRAEENLRRAVLEAAGTTT